MTQIIQFIAEYAKLLVILASILVCGICYYLTFKSKLPHKKRFQYLLVLAHVYLLFQIIMLYLVAHQ